MLSTADEREATATVVAVPALRPYWPYAWAYWASTLANLMRRHRLKKPASRYKAAFMLDEETIALWRRFFDGKAPEAPSQGCPYLYMQSTGTLLYTRIFRDVGLNFKHLLHVQHETDLTGTSLDKAGTYWLDCRLDQIESMGHGKALISVKTRITREHDARGGCRVFDQFIVKGFEECQLAALRDTDASTRRDLSGLQRRPSQLRHLSFAERAMIPVPGDMGKRYGRLSGDANPVHTTRWAARLFGYRQPFIQGHCLRNLVLSRLLDMRINVEAFSMLFVRPVLVDQTVELIVVHDRHAHDRYEVCDREGQLLACGGYRLQRNNAKISAI